MINYHHKITQTVYRLCFHFWTLFWTEINITSLSYMYTVPRPAFMLLKFSSFWLISVLQSCIAIGCSQLKRKKRISVWFNRINAFCNKAFCCWCIFNFSLAHLVWFYRLTRRRLLKKCVWSSKATSCDISKHFPCRRARRFSICRKKSSRLFSSTLVLRSKLFNCCESQNWFLEHGNEALIFCLLISQ